MYQKANSKAEVTMDINNLTVSSVAEMMYNQIENSGPESQNIMSNLVS